MHNDKRTLKDLAFTGAVSGDSIFELTDRCTTFAGREVLQQLLYHPPASFELLQQQQDVVRYWTRHMDKWPEEVTNGTLVMLEKFFESADSYSSHPGGFGILGSKAFQKIFNRSEYFFTQFSLTHLSDLLRACHHFIALSKETQVPVLLQELLDNMSAAIEHRLSPELLKIDKDTAFRDQARLSFHARREMKGNIQKLITLYARLDAWHSLARATLEHQWHFPELFPSGPVQLEATGLYHPLLHDAVRYDLSFAPGRNFMILTGANMSGKTTMMRALGIAAILAHMGMGVPAAAMKISFLQGVVTNMHVEDDLLKGESFFLAEVRSMRHTAALVAGDTPHLVLMDELFKGTNVHDAYECTKAIVDGLLLHPDHIMILSTHLYEVAYQFRDDPRLSFYCFTTTLGEDGNYTFSYQLRPGISDDRIGYKILVKEGIVDLLRQKNQQPPEGDR